MGGLPTLGYDVQNRKLVVNDEEALTVLHIFRRYVELRSVRILQAELDAAGIRSKRRTLADGTPYGGQKLSRGALYLMLQNRIYRGEITHKGNAYPGEHPPIVDKALWDKVQAILVENRVDRATGSDAKYPSLLAGMAFDENGERLTPTHAVKKGTRYRYYVSRSLITGAAKDHSEGRRIPAGNLENLVVGRIRTFLVDEGAILNAIRDEHAGGAEQRRLIGRGRQISEELTTLAPDETRAMLMVLLNRVDVRPDRVEIKVHRRQLLELLQAQSINSCAPAGRPNSDFDDILTLTVKARLQRVGREMRMLVENADDQTLADPGLLRIIARAHDMQERLTQDTDLTVPAIANQERVSTGYLSRLLRLPSLAPDIITAIIAKRIYARFLSSRDLSNAGVPISRRSTSRASSWRSRGILRNGSFGQHRIFNSRSHALRLDRAASCRRGWFPPIGRTFRDVRQAMAFPRTRMRAISARLSKGH